MSINKTTAKRKIPRKPCAGEIKYKQVCITNRDLKPQHFSSKEATFTRSELPYIDNERIESKP